VRDMFEQLAAYCHVVKLSDEDAAWLYPDLEIDDVLNRIVELGAQLAVMTRGSVGSRIAYHSRRLEVVAPRVDVVDTVGAGDSYMAVLVQAALETRIKRLSLKDLTMIAQRCSTAAAITVGRAGADLPRADELVNA